MRYLFFLFFSLVSLLANAQYGFVDHWKTIVYPYDTWRYFEGDQQPPTGWNTTNFNDATWKSGPGGFGFEDGDDSTLIPYDTSVYLRIEFNIFDTT